jgi:glucose-1-phosphate adenylyltransferase
MILAGGEGTRLAPLTRDRAKPAVPFGGRYRLIDFVLSNFVNSGVNKISVLTQYKAGSLMQHLARGWQLSPQLGHYVATVPATMN